MALATYRPVAADAVEVSVRRRRRRRAGAALRAWNCARAASAAAASHRKRHDHLALPSPQSISRCPAAPLPPLSLSLDSARWPSARPPHATPPPGNEGSNSALLASTAPPSSEQRPARFSTCRGSGSRSIAPITTAAERPSREAVTENVNSVALALSVFAYRRISRSHGGPRAVPEALTRPASLLAAGALRRMRMRSHFAPPRRKVISSHFCFFCLTWQLE